MQQDERLQKLLALRRAFRAIRPDLALPEDEDQGADEQRTAFAVEKKKAAIEETAKQYPETIAKVIQRLLDQSKKK